MKPTKAKVQTIDIHGKSYVPVSERVRVAHEEGKFDKLYTEVLSHDPVVIRATVTLGGKEYTGISSVSLQAFKQIEKANPYEVAETSAVGRALGFAGYGIEGGIASAEELQKPVESIRTAPKVQDDGYVHEPLEESVEPATAPQDYFQNLGDNEIKRDVAELMTNGKIEKDFGGLNKMSRIQMIALLKKAA